MKKGFTLIELLAVILILGIIALIAIPTVNNILKEARRGAFSSTLSNIEKAIENECSIAQLKNSDITSAYKINDGNIFPKVDIKGDLPDGTIYVNNNCEISYNLFDNNFTGTKEIGEASVIDDKISNGTYKENILNGADPVLSNNLVPVRIEKDGTVFKADLKSKWYSYEDKIWANAVILTPEGKVEDDGTILEDSIESYFVWVPRYKYKLFDMGNYDSVIEEKPINSIAKTIDIIFENKNVETSNGDELGEYYSHPAFQTFDTNGLWVAKFETTGRNDNIQVKPNHKSLRELNLKNMFELSYNYKRDNNSHMMKNIEWGAVAYLSLSKYGINGQININNNEDFITGYSAVPGTDQSDYPGTYGISSDITLPYNTNVGYMASSTGNISGIYDMSGGAHEYMASFMDGYLGNSGFTEDPTITYSSNYFDKYPNNNNITSYYNRILGDATGEIGPFYQYLDGDGAYGIHNNWWADLSKMIDADEPWVNRGGHLSNGVFASQLFFNKRSGVNSKLVGFRIILTN